MKLRTGTGSNHNLRNFSPTLYQLSYQSKLDINRDTHIRLRITQKQLLNLYTKPSVPRSQGFILAIRLTS